MGRLFWKILLSFWLAMVLTNIVAVLISTQLSLVPTNKLGYMSQGTVELSSDADSPNKTISVTEEKSLASQKSGFSRSNPFQRNPRFLLMRLSIAIFFSGVVCAWLAWYLTKPVRYLRNASNELANGNLDVRVGALIGDSKDELTDLGHDFDYMAERLQLLMKKQQQLLQNISHELRSPLARIHVAMGLAKKKNCGDVSLNLNRIELETNRLECLIAEVLTLARQEDGNINLIDEYIDVAELLKFIVADAEYEAKNKDCHVGFTCDVTPIIQANGELLHRALENIIRNAVKYTVKSSVINVVLKTNTQKEVVEITICDQGRGVPEKFLSSLFEPFVRVADSRDRDSGGYGLGLAIAQHAIVLHGGNVRAVNRESGGLCVEVRLPLHR